MTNVLDILPKETIVKSCAKCSEKVGILHQVLSLFKNN